MALGPLTRERSLLPLNDSPGDYDQRTLQDPPHLEIHGHPTFPINPHFDAGLPDGPYVSAAAAQQNGANLLTPDQACRFVERLKSTVYGEQWAHLRHPANSEIAQLMLEVHSLRKYLVQRTKEAKDHYAQIVRQAVIIEDMQRQLQELGVGIVDADVESVTSSSSEEVAVDDSWEAEEMIPVVHALPEEVIVHGLPLD